MFNVVAKGLTRRFSKFMAVSQLSLEINEGEVFGLLGPNGAGKSNQASHASLSHLALGKKYKIADALHSFILAYCR